MKLWDIVKVVGSEVISNAVPGGSLLVGAINELLPDDKKLPVTATGSDVDAAVSSLPPDQRAAVMEKEFDVDLTQIKESHDTVRAMLEADAKSQHTTRPYIAKGSFIVVAFTIVTVISVWAVGVLSSDDGIVTSVMNGWSFILAVIGPLVTLLWAYFGILKQEHRNKLDAITGSSKPSAIGSLLSSILKR